MRSQSKHHRCCAAFIRQVPTHRVGRAPRHNGHGGDGPVRARARSVEITLPPIAFGSSVPQASGLKLGKGRGACRANGGKYARERVWTCPSATPRERAQPARAPRPGERRQAIRASAACARERVWTRPSATPRERAQPAPARGPREKRRQGSARACLDRASTVPAGASVLRSARAPRGLAPAHAGPSVHDPEQAADERARDEQAAEEHRHRHAGARGLLPVERVCARSGRRRSHGFGHRWQ
jgi:hypothetical protein